MGPGDGDGRPRRASVRAVRGAVGRALGWSRPLRRAALPAPRHLLRRGGARAGRRGRPRDREPRAVLRGHRRRRGRSPRARCRDLRRGPPPRGDRRNLARRAGFAGGTTPPGGRHRTCLPRSRRGGPRPCPRPRRAGGRAPPPGGVAAGRTAQAARDPRRVGARPRRRPGRTRGGARRPGRGARPARSSRPRDRGTGGGLPRAGGPRAGRVVRARDDRLGPRGRLGRAPRPAVGGRPHRNPRLGDADDRGGRGIRPPPTRARQCSRARRGLAVRLSRAGPSLRSEDDARPSRRRVHRTGGRRGAGAARTLPRACSRAHVELPGSRRAPRQDRGPGPVRGARSGRGAA